MRDSDIEIRSGGKTVNVRIPARDRDAAWAAATHCDDNPPLGYILLKIGVSRRAKGGRGRALTLTFRSTENADYPPISYQRGWVEMLRQEQGIARGDLAPQSGL